MNYEPPQRNNGQLLRVEAMNTKLASGIPDYIELFPYITAYSEVFNQTWNIEDVYGRMDGIPNYLNTKRTINLTLRVMAANLAQAKENLYLISKFARFCYPGITKQGNLHNIKVAPILRLKLGTIIKDAATNGGLWGFINGALTITPLIEYGWFTPVKTSTDIPSNIENNAMAFNPLFGNIKNIRTEVANPLRNSQKDTLPDSSDSTILFKYVEISFQYCVLHNHLLGQDSEDMYGGFFDKYFPYSADKPDYALDPKDKPEGTHEYSGDENNKSESWQSHATDAQLEAIDASINNRNKETLRNANIRSAVEAGIKSMRETTILMPSGRTPTWPTDAQINAALKETRGLR